MSSIWAEQIPSRLKVAKVYANRALYWRSNSSPFISGDLFADEADICMFPPRFRGKNPDLSQIKSAQVIFCPSDKLQDFLHTYGNTIRAKVIISGNSDFEFHTIPADIPKSVKQLFLQNSFVSNSPLVSTLPIGIENVRWGVNGFPKLMREGGPWESRENRVLIGPFGLTCPERIEVRENFLDFSDSYFFVKNRLTPKKYSSLMGKYRYVAAVRGNGVDTHRFWEALYRGSVPVVKRNVWLEGIRHLKLPFMEVYQWEPGELAEITEKKVNLSFNSKDLAPLWWPFWKKKIAEYL